MLVFFAGCATVTPPKVGTIHSPAQDKNLSRGELDQRLSRADVVLVGETHHHPEHHRIQLDTLKTLAEMHPGLVVGVEWLDHSAQKSCDQLSAGKLTVEEFAKQVDWEHAWGFPLKLYAPIFEEVRRRGLKLVALNAPVDVIKQIGRKGLKSLSPKQRTAIAPSLDLDDPVYLRMVAFQFKSHGVKGKARQENFFAAQVARDETMAGNLARSLEPWPDGGKKGLVFAGSGHMVHGMGLAPRIARRLPGAKLLTLLPVSTGRRGAMGGAQAMPRVADVIIYTGPPPPRPRRPRLGLMLETKPQGLLVEKVLPGSVAAKAGFKAGDMLLSVDHKPLKEVKDIHRALMSAPFAEHAYLVERDGVQLVIKAAIPGKRP